VAEDKLNVTPRATEDPSDSAAKQDASRCKRVEDALYRRACGYKVKLKKSYKVKTVEYDRDTGKKLEEREDLKEGFEEVHIPADVRVCAYYLNNRSPARWREHPAEAEERLLGGVVDYPEMETLETPCEGEGGDL
jgi:hypothetical protein